MRSKACIVVGALAVAILAGCDSTTGHPGPGQTDNTLIDKAFVNEVEKANLDIDAVTARREARNVCSDMKEIAPDPANINPFGMYALAQRVALRTGLSVEDAGSLMGIGMAAYCPEYGEGFGK